MFLDEKTVLKIGLILGYTQPSFQELGLYFSKEN